MSVTLPRRPEGAEAAALASYLAAVRELHRCSQRLAGLTGGVAEAILDVLLADVHIRLGAELGARVGEWARQLAPLGTADAAGAPLGESQAERNGALLASLVNVVRGYAGMGKAFCEAQALFLESLEARASWQSLEAGGGSGPVEAELTALEAAYGEDYHADKALEDGTGQASVRVWSDDALDKELRVTLHIAGGTTASARADGGWTSSDELVLNAIFRAWQRLGGLSAWEAVDVARKTFCSALAGRRVGDAVPLPALLLDARAGSWFEWRLESASLEFFFFSLTEVVKQAEACVRQYFKKHDTFELIGDPEVVISEVLSQKFAAKLEEIRQSSAGCRLRSPGLVFHASPSRDALQSILQRGFLLPGDWIQGTPLFLNAAHGACSGVGVYCSPGIDMADCYCGSMSDSRGKGLVIVALAAFGLCWEPTGKEDTTMQRSKRSWFNPPTMQQQGVHGGWSKKGDFWVATEATDASSSAAKKREEVLAYEPNAQGLYEDAYHSRRPQAGAVLCDEVVLGSPEQLLPLLLVTYRPKGFCDTESASSHKSSNVYKYDSDGPPPSRKVVCTPLSDKVAGKALADLPLKDDAHWAIFIPWDAWNGGGCCPGGADGVDQRTPSVRLCFLLDESLCCSAFKEQVGLMVHGLAAALQPAEVAALWFNADVNTEASIPFVAPEKFRAVFEVKTPRFVQPSPRGANTAGAEGLIRVLPCAVDGCLRKLTRETERYLARVSNVWHRLEEGDELLAMQGLREGRLAVVRSVDRDVFRVTRLELGWRLPGGRVQVQHTERVESQDEAALTVVWACGSSTRFAPVAVRSRHHARDAAAENHFLFVLVLSDSMTMPDRGGENLTELAEVVGNCSAQLRGSGARCSWAPVVLGRDVVVQQLGAYIKMQLSTGTGASGEGCAAWWEAVHCCERPEELAPLVQGLQEDLLTWARDGTRLGVEVALDLRQAVHGQGFVVDPLELPRWEARVRRPRPDLEGASLMRGTCLLWQGRPPRSLSIEGVAVGVELREELWPSEQPSAALELGFALERLAQKLRIAAIAAEPRVLGIPRARARIQGWADRLREWASHLADGGATRKLHSSTSVAAMWVLTPVERSALLRQRRSLVNGLQRTTNCLEDALRMHDASEKEQDAAIWLKLVKDMRFSRSLLKRAAKVAVPERLALEQLQAEVAQAPRSPLEAAGTRANEQACSEPRSHTSGLSAWEHVKQAHDVSAVGFQDMQSALYTMGMVGVQVRCTRTEASNVDPWQLIVDYVSSSFADTVSATCGLDIGQPLSDEQAVEAPDVVVLIPEGSEEPQRWFTKTVLYQAYLGVVFARNPLCALPVQRLALPVLVWVKSGEQLLLLRGRGGAAGIADEVATSVSRLCRVHALAAHTVRCAAVEGGAWGQLARRLAKSSDSSLAQLLTEADEGPQSVCIALAAACFSPAAEELWQGAAVAGLATAKLRSLALALLAEAVSRGCRKLCRSRGVASAGGEAAVEQQMLWDALGITAESVPWPEGAAAAEPAQWRARAAHSDAFDLPRALKRSALFFAPEGKYFQMGLTNCTPQGVVASLLLHLVIRQTGNAASITPQLCSRKISMKAFIETVLPGTNPSYVQAALYVQGLRYHCARDRATGVTPLSEPERILRELAQEQRHAAYMERLQIKSQAEGASRRRDARVARRLAALAAFDATHRVFPRLFTVAEVDELNLGRPADAQLERLPTGLLKHHCCFPQCPQYLQDLRSKKDRQSEVNGPSNRRHGLFQHLAPSMWPEAVGDQQYVPLLHSIGAVVARGARKPEGFSQSTLKRLEEQLAKRPAHKCLAGWLEDGLADVYVELKRIGM